MRNRRKRAASRGIHSNPCANSTNSFSGALRHQLGAATSARTPVQMHARKHGKKYFYRVIGIPVVSGGWVSLSFGNRRLASSPHCLHR
jgi:hypothetical protein